VLKDRIEALQGSREIALAALDRARSASRPTQDISPAAVDLFARAMRDKLLSGAIPFRKAYIRSIVDRIEVAGASRRKALGIKPPSASRRTLSC
jgi:hypothetical protein